MPAPVIIWLEIAHHAAFRIGGWAYVRLNAGVVSGTAGGERQTDPERSALTAISAALGILPPGSAVELHTSSPLVLATPRRIGAAEAGEDPPNDNLDLWAKVSVVLGRVDLVVRRAQPTPGGTSAFAAAWADFAQGRARARGLFSAPIPKVNLAKAGVLD